jgi:hypothetical protein
MLPSLIIVIVLLCGVVVVCCIGGGAGSMRHVGMDAFGSSADLVDVIDATGSEVPIAPATKKTVPPPVHRVQHPFAANASRADFT